MTDAGWGFWISGNGKIRHFAVGALDEDAAKLIIQREHPDINFLNFVSKQRLAPDVVEMLGLANGRVMEWEAADERSKIEAQGSDIGSGYDPYKG